MPTIELSEILCENLTPGCELEVETVSRHYHLEYLAGDRFRISGHPQFCPAPVPATLAGSLTSAGNFRTGVIGRHMRMMFRGLDERPLLTSEVTSVRLESHSGRPR